jgi:hypothetical protein
MSTDEYATEPQRRREDGEKNISPNLLIFLCVCGVSVARTKN